MENRIQRRIVKRRERIHKEFYRYKKYQARLWEHTEDILTSKKFKATREHIQHGGVSVNEHVKSVARTSLAINEKFRLGADEKQLARGALLHDYFLYDWHDKEYLQNRQRLHGYHHPATALKNASEDYDLSEKEKDIIRNHMWPLTITHFPKHKEGWIVLTADKYCSLLETLRIHKGRDS